MSDVCAVGDSGLFAICTPVKCPSCGSENAQKVLHPKEYFDVLNGCNDCGNLWDWPVYDLIMAGTDSLVWP